MQNGKTAAALAEVHGHANVAALLTARTDRPVTNRTPSSLQTSTTPLASSLPASQGVSPLHNLPSQNSPPMHQSSSSQQRSERASAPCLATTTSSSSGAQHAVSYPSIFGAAPAQNPPSPHHMGQLGSEHALASRSHAPSYEEASRLNRSGSDRRQSEPPVQADAPALGYVPGALSFIRNKLQVLLLYQTCNCTCAAGHSQSDSIVIIHTKQQSATLCLQVLVYSTCAINLCCLAASLLYLHTCPTILTPPPPFHSMLPEFARHPCTVCATRGNLYLMLVSACIIADAVCTASQEHTHVLAPCGS
jgi:hypothetical protein